MMAPRNPRLAASFLAIAALLPSLASAAASIGNFAVSSSSCSLGDVIINPPQFEVFLTLASANGTGLSFSIDGAAPVTFAALFASAQGDTVFPVCRLGVVTPSGLIVSFNAFAPISATDPEPAFLPTLVAQVSVVNPTDADATVSVQYTLAGSQPTGYCNGSASAVHERSLAYGRAGSMFVGATLGGGSGAGGSAVAAAVRGNCTGGSGGGGGGPPDACATLTLALPRQGGAARGALIVGFHSRDGRYAPAYNDSGALLRAVAGSVDALAAGHAGFVGALPLTGAPADDASVRWFLQAPVLLTKGRRNLTWTMGYNELNQRDSFWSSWLHLLFWPRLDADMLLESAAGQQPDGKIPVTVLPVILRDDNVDTTCYYVLRLARHYGHTGNETLLRGLYPSARRALVYLRSRDFGGHGVPEANASTFWADWLDVPYVQGRRYAPHYDLLYLAAVRAGSRMAAALGEAADAALFEGWFELGHAFVNAEFAYVYNSTLGGYDATGLWNDTRGAYTDAWTDGRPIEWSYADQSVGSFFGVVPADRAQRVQDWLHFNGTENQFGLRNVWPYFTFNVTGMDPPGQYGNGGIYPWFNCVTVAARLRMGLATRGASLFTNLANNMLYRPDQPALNTPWEYAHGDTGLDDGDAPQGWDGSCFLRASLGAWGLAPVTRGVWGAHPPDGLGEGEGGSGERTYHLTLPHVLYGAPAGSADRDAGGGDGDGGVLRSSLPVLGAGGEMLVLSVAAGRVAGGRSGVLPAQLELSLHADAVAAASGGDGGDGLGRHAWAWTAPCVRSPGDTPGCAGAAARAAFMCGAAADPAGRWVRVVVHARPSVL